MKNNLDITTKRLWGYLNYGHTMEEAIKHYSMGE
jgi:hypothetical protein